MIEQVFTFGMGHVCPYTRRPLADHYVTIAAESKEQARQLMVRLFNDRWAFQYDALPQGYPMVEHARLVVIAPDVDHSQCDHAGKPVRCDRCGRQFVCTPSDDFYCAAEGDHCCEACLVGGLPVFTLDPSTLDGPR